MIRFTPRTERTTVAPAKLDENRFDAIRRAAAEQHAKSNVEATSPQLPSVRPQ